MAEEVRMQIIRDSVVLEDISVILPLMPDSSNVADVLAAAFIDHWGPVMHANPAYDPTKADPQHVNYDPAYDPETPATIPAPTLRNITTRIRERCESELSNYLEKQGRGASDTTVSSQVATVVGGMTIQENLT